MSRLLRIGAARQPAKGQSATLIDQITAGLYDLGVLVLYDAAPPANTSLDYAANAMGDVTIVSTDRLNPVGTVYVAGTPLGARLFDFKGIAVHDFTVGASGADLTLAGGTLAVGDILTVALGPTIGGTVTRGGTRTTPELPRYTPNFDGIAITNDTVSLATGGDIAAAIASMIAAGKHRLLLAAGGSYTLSTILTIPDHGYGDVWCEITTDATLPALGTRMDRDGVTTYNLPTITFDGETQIQFAAGAHHWRLRGLQILSGPTDAGVNGGLGFHRRLIQIFPDTLTAKSDVPHTLSFRQLVVGGDDQGVTNHHGTSNRQGAFVANATKVEIADCTTFALNFGGLDYGDQGQSVSVYAGLGGIRIENNNLWGCVESIAFGGASQWSVFASEQRIPSDITIRKNHIYRPLSIKGFQECANQIEFKLGRRILSEYNVLENVWQEGQNGCNYIFWSVNQDLDQSWTHASDITVRYEWWKNCASGLLVRGNDSSEVGPSIDAIRALFEHIAVTGENAGVFAGDSACRSFADVAPFTYGTFQNMCLVNDSAKSWWTADTVAVSHLTVQNNILGGAWLLFTSLGTGDTAWTTYIDTDGTDTFAGNGCADFGFPSTPNPSGNTVVTTLAGLGLVDATTLSDTSATLASLANLKLSAGSALKGKAVGGGDPGPDIDAIIAGLTGVEMSSTEKARYDT